MSGQFEDPDDPHDPEELSNPPHLHQVPAHVLPHQSDADVVAGEEERKVLQIEMNWRLPTYGRTARKSIMFIGFLINLILEGHLEDRIRFCS